MIYFSLTCHIWYAFVDQQINALMEYFYVNIFIKYIYIIIN